MTLRRRLALAFAAVAIGTAAAIALATPLVITREECDELVARARKTFDDLADALTREGAL